MDVALTGYEAALEYLFARTTGVFKFGLERTHALLGEIGNPHLSYPVLHLAGTIGKGSSVATADALLRAFAQDIRPFLESGGRKSGPVSSRRQSRDYFTVLRNLVSADAHPAVDAIEQLCDRCRDLKVQRRVHRLLHGWLTVHLPLSVALILLLIVHVVYALRFG